MRCDGKDKKGLKHVPPGIRRSIGCNRAQGDTLTFSQSDIVVNNEPSYEFFMSEALHHAEKALVSGEFPVGCVLVYNDQIIAAGSREGTAASATNEIDHAEMIALRQLNLLPRRYDLDPITAFCTLEPCLMCYGALLISGIRRIVFAYEDAMGGGTRCDLTLLPTLYKNVEVAIIPHILRKNSLRLFKAYFDNPANSYLSNTYLADYTRRQDL
jgi:tRNA(adenine34) deaminase